MAPKWVLVNMVTATFRRGFDCRLVAAIQPTGDSLWAWWLSRDGLLVTQGRCRRRDVAEKCAYRAAKRWENSLRKCRA